MGCSIHWIFQKHWTKTYSHSGCLQYTCYSHYLIGERQKCWNNGKGVSNIRISNKCTSWKVIHRFYWLHILIWSNEKRLVNVPVLVKMVYGFFFHPLNSFYIILCWRQQCLSYKIEIHIKYTPFHSWCSVPLDRLFWIKM